MGNVRDEVSERLLMFQLRTHDVSVLKPIRRILMVANVDCEGVDSGRGA